MREDAEKWAGFILANLLWVLFAIPLITLPAATAGAYAAIAGQSRAKDMPFHFFETFFGTMRRLWLKATAVGLLDLLLGGLIVLNFWIFGRMGTLDVMAFLARSVTLFVALLLLLTNLYVWPLLALSDMPLRELIDTSFKLMFAHPLWSVGLLALTAVPIIVSLLLPRAAFLLFTASACLFVVDKGTWPIIRQHIPEEMLTYR